MKRLASLPRPIRVYGGIVLLNYAAQIAYAADLYGSRISVAGAVLLGATFLWFVLGFVALADGRPAGYVALIAYAAAQVAFYFHGQVILAFSGYGLPYNLSHARDAIVLTVFLIGDLNFVAAAMALVYLAVRRASLRAFSSARLPE